MAEPGPGAGVAAGAAPAASAAGSTGAAPVAGSTVGVLRAAAAAWRQYPGLASVAIGALAAQQAFFIWLAFSLKDIINDVTTHKPAAQLEMLLLGLSAGFVVAAVATVAGERASAQAAAQIVNHLRRQLYHQVLHLSPDYFLTRPPAAVVSSFADDLKTLEGGYIQGFLDTVVIAFSALITVPLLFWLDWRLATITCLSLPVVVVVVDRMLPGSLRANSALGAAETRLFSAVEESIAARQVVRVFHLHDRLADRFEGLLTEVQQRAVDARGLAARVVKGASLGALVVQVAVVIAGAELAGHHVLTIGSLIAFIAVLNLVAKNVYDFARGDIPLLANAGRARRGIDDLLCTPIAVTDPSDGTALDEIEGAIHFQHVNFSYLPGKPALSDVSFEIPARGTVAVVGPNGSGKSTLLNLLVRLYDPQEGAITLDGRDLRQVTQRSFRSQMAVVLQDNFVFNDTIRENIRIGAPGASDEDTVMAAKRAELHDFVMSLPHGYDTVVGEAGGRLSRGQRQRLAIARAMIRDPRVLLLDEVTTALDPATEASIHEMLVRAGKERTVISVTHRLAATTNADEILVLDRGTLIERGRHDDLHAANGVYRRLWEKQSGFEVSNDGRHATVDATRLRHVALFTDLDDDTLADIAAGLNSEYHDAGQHVFAEGEVGDRFYLIARGRVTVVSRGLDRTDHVLDVLNDGDHFGELALIEDRPRSATIRTETPCVFLTMGREEFLGLVASTPAMLPMLEGRMARSHATLDAWRSAEVCRMGAERPEPPATDTGADQPRTVT